MLVFDIVAYTAGKFFSPRFERWFSLPTVKVAKLKNVLRLFLPMATASLLFTLTPALINASIVRAAKDYEAALAAYSVARSLMMVLSAFTFMAPNAFLVLVHNEVSYRKFRNLIAAAAAASLFIGFLVIFTPLRDSILQNFLGLSNPLAERAGRAIAAMLLLPPLIIWRSFSHGVLIRKGKTSYWLWGALAGFLVLFLGLALARYFYFLNGAVYGATVVSLSTAADGSILHLCARKQPKLSFSDEQETAAVVRYRRIIRYFLPLLFTTWIMMLSPTFINAALARTYRPETALAAFAVTNSFIFAFESPVVALRNTILAFRATFTNLRMLQRFCIGIGGLATLVLCAVAWTPMIHFVLSSLFGISGEVHAWAVPAIRVMSPTLFIISWRQFQFAVLMRAHKTRIIGIATVVRVIVLVGALALALRLLTPILPSAVAAGAYLTGFLIETLIAFSIARRLVASARISGDRVLS